MLQVVSRSTGSFPTSMFNINLQPSTSNLLKPSATPCASTNSSGACACTDRALATEACRKGRRVQLNGEEAKPAAKGEGGR